MVCDRVKMGTAADGKNERHQHVLWTSHSLKTLTFFKNLSNLYQKIKKKSRELQNSKFQQFSRKSKKFQKLTLSKTPKSAIIMKNKLENLQQPLVIWEKCYWVLINRI
jgi:hypothetical protein